MKDILLPSPRREERGGEQGEGLSFPPDKYGWMQLKPFPLLLNRLKNNNSYSASSMLRLSIYSPLLLCCLPLQCIQHVNFDPPTACQTVDPEPRAIRWLRVSGAFCLKFGVKASEFVPITVRVIRK